MARRIPFCTLSSEETGLESSGEYEWVRIRFSVIYYVYQTERRNSGDYAF